MNGSFATGVAANARAQITDLDDDLDPDEDIFLDELDDDWEDKEALARIRSKIPPEWHLVKMLRYTPALMREVDEWLAENCRGEWKKHGWSTGCSYSVAISFSTLPDAVLFKLRWCCA